jgi:hypothetical protein
MGVSAVCDFAQASLSLDDSTGLDYVRSAEQVLLVSLLHQE